MRAATVVKQLCKSCRTCFMFIASFILLMIAPLPLQPSTDQLISRPNERLVDAPVVEFRWLLVTMAVIACISNASAFLSPQRSAVCPTLNTSTIFCSQSIDRSIDHLFAFCYEESIKCSLPSTWYTCTSVFKLNMQKYMYIRMRRFGLVVTN